MTDGIPFMITGSMKTALRRCGLADADIDEITPEEAHKLLMAPNPHAVRMFFKIFVDLAQRSLGGQPPPGHLQTSRKHPNDEDLVPTRYRLDSADLIERMTHDALVDSEAGHNVYAEGRFVKFGQRGRARGEFEATVCCFALIIDSDADKNMAWIPPAGVDPTLTVETSPGNHQFWFFLDEAVSPGRAKALGDRIRKATGSDHDSGTVTQPYRVGGTVNHPNRAKADRGRIATPTWILALPIDLSRLKLWTPEELEATFVCGHPPVSSRPNGAGTQGASAGADDIDELALPDDLMDLILNGVPQSRDRSRMFMGVVAGLKELGFTVDGVYRLLARYPDGIADKYLRPKDRLKREIERGYAKIIHAAPASPATAPSASPVSPASSSSSPLADAHVTFRRWLGEKYDTVILDAVASAAAAERLAATPCGSWLLQDRAVRKPKRCGR